MMTRGLFITFEGDDGTGKSTHIRFLAGVLRSMGYDVLCLREPGGTDISEALRKIVLDPANDAMDARAEFFIYEAARAQLVAQVIKPTLEAGTIVLCDRFSDSTVAYQGYGRGLPIDAITMANELACQGVSPDKTLLIVCGDLSARTSKRAASAKGLDRLERAGDDFHAAVSAGFRKMAQENPDRFAVVESQPAPSDTSRAVLQALTGLFPWLDDYLANADEAFEALDARVLRDAPNVTQQLFDRIAHTVQASHEEARD